MIRPRQYILLLVFALLPHGLEILPSAYLVSIGIVLWALLADYKPQFAPPKWMKVILTLFAPAFIFFKTGTILGPEAATPLLVILVSIKMFDVYSYRDSIVILSLTLLLGVYHLVFRQDLFATIYILILLTWVFAYLFRRHQPEGVSSNSKIQLRSLLGPETLVSIPMAILMFVFFPRITSPFGRYVDSPDSNTGFSEELKPGDMANLANSDEVAFRVEFKSDSTPLVSELYFFGQSLSETNGLDWSKSKKVSSRNSAPESKGPKGFEYRLTIEPRFGRQVFYLSKTTDLQVRGVNTAFSFMSNDAVLLRSDATKSYQVTGTTSKAPIQAEQSESDNLGFPKNFLDKNPRLAQLLEDKKFIGENRHQTVRKLMTFFSEQQFRYSLSTPSYRNIDELLFDQKTGFCEHFASAFALMARALGVPARVVVGFQGGELNDYGNYIIVRDRHAHAWVEVMYEDKTWNLADPTGVVNLRRISLGDNPERFDALQTDKSLFSAALASSLLYLDSLNSQLVLFYLNFDGGSQIQFLENLGWFGNVDKKTLWLILGSIIICGALFIYFFLRWQRPKSSFQVRLRQELNQKLKALDVGFTENLGPIETLELLIDSPGPKTEPLREIVTEYARLYYSKSSAQPEELKALLSKLNQI